MSKNGKGAIKSGKSDNFDKYAYYLKSVQSPDTDVLFLRDVYKELRGKRPTVLREDFCGTFSILCEWVKLHPSYLGVGIDLDHEPTDYGKTHHLARLKPAQQKNVQIYNENVLSKKLAKADIIVAMNFSYFIFKTRSSMKEYFSNAFSCLNEGGLFIVDCFGGPACQEPNVEKVVHKGFSYFWDQESFDAITHHAVFHIHFKIKGEGRKRKNVFSYDWRMWSIPELRDIMEEVGFRRTHVYWEGTTKSGDGNGEFTRAEVTNENCDAWVAYIVGEK
jgi:hypothetical protein